MARGSQFPRLVAILALLCCWLDCVTSLPTLETRADPAPGPFKTSGRWILDANGKRFKMKCVHWVGHMEPNIPEGLQFQSIDWISSWIAQNNFNCVRLSYSIDMALGQDVTVKDSFTAAAKSTNTKDSDMMNLYKSITQNNPSITANTTVGEVFEQTVSSLDKHGVKVILDNHVSKAGFCCNKTDGNGWFKLDGVSPDSWEGKDSTYFDTGNWLNGLEAMAQFAHGKPAVIAMDTRNELRPIWNDNSTWYKYIDEAARRIHDTNSDLLIVIGGVNYATDLGFLYGSPLDTSAYPDRVVWEFHNYLWSHWEQIIKYDPLDAACPLLQHDLGGQTGFLLDQNQAYTGPLWLSEFGVNTVSPSQQDTAWLQCLVSYMSGNDAEWSVWTVGGSYYVRESQINYDESFGLLDAQWKGWRNEAFVGWLGSMWNISQGP